MNPSHTALRFSPERALELGRQTLSIEAAAVDALKNRINADFSRAVELILNCHGRLIVSGMGKSGHVARKIATTMASTGAPAYFDGSIILAKIWKSRLCNHRSSIHCNWLCSQI